MNPQLALKRRGRAGESGREEIPREEEEEKGEQRFIGERGYPTVELPTTRSATCLPRVM